MAMATGPILPRGPASRQKFLAPIHSATSEKPNVAMPTICIAQSGMIS